ncbi:uncharacterized protein LOC121879289 [Homarus americanus]|uniref:uncharacterized protein LOC121879289 n=1 Tax=Homarus americanus TaxID=6706 RepID=UPI001C439C89|nr:uncharacterized protein LOC121879289 [Homarus americanus]
MQTHTQAGSCRDQLYGCPEWARRGLCDYDLKFMYEKCSASCNVCLDKCEDRLPDCQERVARGMCKTKLHLMYRQCSYSCNVCVGNCWNYSPECPLWAERNLCETDPLFMHQKCPVSCEKVVDADCVDKSNNSIVELPPLPSNDKNINNLSLLPIKQRSIVHPDFECGRPIQTLTATTTNNRRHRNTDMMEVIISGQKARLRRASIDQVSVSFSNYSSEQLVY